MTARRGIDIGNTDIYLSNQAAESPTSQSLEAQAEQSEMQESMTHLFGGLSGLLFALSLSFFLQAPLISVGVLVTLLAGWTGRTILLVRHDRKKSEI